MRAGLSALVGLRGRAQQEQGSPRQALGSGERPSCLPSSLSLGEEVPTDAVIRDLIFFFSSPGMAFLEVSRSKLAGRGRGAVLLTVGGSTRHL